jgi:hypothetical protein
MSLDLLIVVAGASAVAAAWEYIRRRRVQRSFQLTPRFTERSPVGSTVIAIGRVRTIEGRELDAPLSLRPCVAYRARVYIGPVGESTWWGTANVTSFELERPGEVPITIEAGSHVEFRFPALPLPADAPDRCEAFAISLNLDPKVRKKAAYEEIIVLEDMRIAVRGRLVENGARPRLAGDATSPIIIAVPF